LNNFAPLSLPDARGKGGAKENQEGDVYELDDTRRAGFSATPDRRRP